MRVISGILKGREIKGYNLEGTRPTMDRVKESLFAMIQDNIKGALCLDLFAGSGSLGIEAVSNGAEYVYFVDNNKEAIRVIQNNVSHFKIEEQCNVMLKDYKEGLKYFKDNNMKFDLIFLDPPYNERYLSSILEYINESKLLNTRGQVVCEFTSDELQESYGNLKCIKEKKYGDKRIKIYRNE